ncbi:hypothetical protein [Methylobacterium sp. J-070]|uniref:hypothetical protein n=1 Tax=Methylobacterium sp. J-070 TaxID=2836650 RepID=UPI001FB92AFF|nr:hypothetical protein [Methylobacterium sp. J-070]MCJ2051161.1 hypothetical protein [Methylobacterium sp. J-070]
MSTPADTLDAVRGRLHAHLRAGSASRLFLAAAALLVQRLAEASAADPEDALRIALAAEAAALSVPHVAPLENRHVSL